MCRELDEAAALLANRALAQLKLSRPEQMPRATPQIDEADGFEIREMREMRHYMLNYGHRIKHEPSSKEVERYSDRYNHKLRPTSVWGSVTAAAAHALVGSAGDGGKRAAEADRARDLCLARYYGSGVEARLWLDYEATVARVVA